MHEMCFLHIHCYCALQILATMVPVGTGLLNIKRWWGGCEPKTSSHHHLTVQIILYQKMWVRKLKWKSNNFNILCIKFAIYRTIAIESPVQWNINNALLCHLKLCQDKYPQFHLIYISYFTINVFRWVLTSTS